MRHLNRVAPVGPPRAYQTFQVLAPLSTHFRPASCAEAACTAHLNGWRTVVPAGSDLLDVIRRSGRRHTEHQVDGGLVEFLFEAGQECFKAHLPECYTTGCRLPDGHAHFTRLDRGEIYVVKDGDWRSSANRRQHANADDWVDEFANHQDQLKTKLERG